MNEIKSLINQKFGRWTAKYPLPQRDHKGGVIRHCEYEFGNTIDVPYNWLVYNNMRSCGCQKKEHDQMLPSFITRVDGTLLDMIKSKKLPADNTSGIKWTENNPVQILVSKKSTSELTVTFLPIIA